MRNIGKFAGLIASVVLLVSCSWAPVKSPQPTNPPASAPAATPVVTPPASTEALTHTPASTMIPLPTTKITEGLPDPAAWQPSLKLDANDYPRVDGSTANLPLGVYMRALITGQSLAECELATKFSMTGQSYLALANREADLLVVYEAPDEIKTQLDNMGAKLVKKSIGLDALVFLTNDGNPVEGLTHDQIIGIYTGKIKNWDEVGGEKSAIVPYQRQSNSGSQAMMAKLVMKGTAMMQVPTILQPGEMSGLVDAIASYDNTKNALGYSVYYYVRNMYQVPGIKLLAVGGIAPNADSIASGQYPYVNPFYAVIRQDEPADSPTRKLFDWLTGPEGKRAITEAGYVAVK